MLYQEAILARIEKSRKRKIEKTRDARSNSRRYQTVLSHMGEDVGDLVKFNQLKVLFVTAGRKHVSLDAPFQQA